MTTLWTMTLSAAALILVTLGIRALCQSRVPAQVLPWLWLPAIIRLLVPGQVSLLPAGLGAAALPLGTQAGLFATGATGTGASQATGTTLTGILSSQTTPAAAWGVSPLGAIWLCGLLLVSLSLLLQRLYWAHRLRDARPVSAQQVMPAWQAVQPIRRPVRVLRSARAYVPMTCGVLRPRVYLPSAMDPQALPYVLLHEGVHIQRLHALVRGIALLCACLHWFNPLSWVLVLCLGRDLELACDARVLALLSPVQRRGYAHTVVAMASRRAPCFASAFAKHPVQGRVLRMLRPSGLRGTGIALLCALLLVSGLAFAGVAEEALPETITYERSEYTLDVPVKDQRIIDDQRVLFSERLCNYIVTDAQMFTLFAARGIELVLPPQTLPSGFTRTHEVAALRYRAPGPTVSEGKITMVPPDFVPPEGPPEEVIEEDGVRTERWTVPASALSDTFNETIIRYENAQGEKLSLQIQLATMQDIFAWTSGSHINWIGRLDSGLVLVKETVAGTTPVLYAVPEDAYIAYKAGDEDIETLVYIAYADSADLADALLEMITLAKPGA